MKIIFVTDLHGSEWKYNRLFEVTADSKAYIVINGGDMLLELLRHIHRYPL